MRPQPVTPAAFEPRIEMREKVIVDIKTDVDDCPPERVIPATVTGAVIA